MSARRQRPRFVDGTSSDVLATARTSLTQELLFAAVVSDDFDAGDAVDDSDLRLRLRLVRRQLRLLLLFKTLGHLR